MGNDDLPCWSEDVYLYSLMLGIPPQIVMKWTGHSDYAAMKPYIAIADSVKSDTMAKFDEKLL